VYEKLDLLEIQIDPFVNYAFSAKLRFLCKLNSIVVTQLHGRSNLSSEFDIAQISHSLGYGAN
jgi:hypothetical protein